MEINIDVEELFLILTPFCQLLHVVSLLVIASELVLPTDEPEDRFDINFVYSTDILEYESSTHLISLYLLLGKRDFKCHLKPIFAVQLSNL